MPLGTTKVALTNELKTSVVGGPTMTVTLLETAVAPVGSTAVNTAVALPSKPLNAVRRAMSVTLLIETVILPTTTTE